MARWSELWKLLRGIRREAELTIPPLVESSRRGVTPPPVQSGKNRQWGSPPPVQTPQNRKRKEDDEQDIELLGRDASYNDRDFQRVIENEVRVVKSSNVYSYYFEQETATSGILFVTFLFWEPGVKADEREGPGLTYAYYDFQNAKYQAFNMAASDSAGKAVWDFCRERGTVHGHQHRYRLIQSSGDYVPRKATAKGFAERTLVSSGLSPRSRQETFRRSESGNQTARQFFKRSTLAPTAGFIRRAEPNRGGPNRGEPNRGK